MKRKKISALIMAIIMCLTLIQPYISAADAVKLTVIDATPGHEKHPYSNLVDGDKTTSWGMDWLNGTSTAYAILKAPTKITAYAYAVTTGEDAQSYKNRNPKDWTLYGSNDYDETTKTDGTWVKLDQIQNDDKLKDVNSQSCEYDINDTASYLYYKLEITANKGNTFLKISEFELLDAANKPVTFTAVDGTPGNDGQEYNNLFDNDTKTKWCMDKTAAYVVVKASDPIIVNGYTLTTANDNSTWKNRNPKDWTLYGSNDYDETTKTDGTWEAIHSVTNDNVMKDVNFTPYSFDCSGNTKPYTYYKLDITKNKGSATIQLSELSFTYTVDIHNWEEISRTEPTCTSPGNSNQKCTDCGITRTVKIPAIEHVWEEISRTEPACFDDGEVDEECSICHEKRKTTIPPLGHIKGEDGKCSRCNEYIIKVGSIYYCDLQEALNAAALPNDAVTMLQDIAIQNTLTVGTKKTLELNGFTLKKINSGRVINVCGDFTLKDSSENHTGKIIGGSDTDGGGVYVNSDDTFNMQGGTISECSATDSGGGVYVMKAAKFNMSDSAVIENCTAGNYGGGIKSNGTVTITNSKIVNCTAAGGGGIYEDASSSGGTLTMSDSTVEKCTATDSGGGIYAKTASVTLTNCNVNENSANNYAGGIYTINGSILKMDGCTVQKNTVNNSGGGILAGSLIADLKNCNVNENSAKYGGGVAANGGELILENTQITKNIATDKGGGIYEENSSKLTVTDSYIQENTASTDGGGIYAANISSVSFKSGSIDGNSAQWGGGVYLFKGSDMTVSNGSIANNTAADSGGGVYLYKGSSMTISDGSITNNTAKNNGGGITMNDFATLKINGKYTNKIPTLTMTGGSIRGNKVTNNSSDDGNGNGGGIYGQKKAVINISGGTIDSNNALNGGGISLCAGSAATITGGGISENIARTGNGGGIYVKADGSLTLAGGSVSKNHAVGLGGGIYNDSSVLTVENDPHVMHNNISKYVTDDTGCGYAEPLRDNNIYLPSGKKISGSLKEVVAPPMIYVTLADVSQDITGEFDSDCSSYIRSDDNKYAVMYDEQTKTHKLGESVLITLIEFEGETGEARHDYAAKGKAYTPSYQPWRSGYRFLGWCKDGKMYDFSQPVNEPITLTAKWTEYGNAYIGLTKDGYEVSGPFGTGVICLASYDNSGALIDTAIAEVSEGAGKQLFSNINFITEGAARISAFMWENMNPICDRGAVALENSDNDIAAE